MSVHTSNNKARSAYEKATSVFPLQNPDPATGEAWELYTVNRLQAPKLVFDDEDEEENQLDISREFFCAIGYAMSTLEKEMKLKHNVLYKGYRVIECNGYYSDGQKRDVCEVIGPESVTILSRVYSPTRPLYIDVHLDYRWLWANDDTDIGFEYRIGFKIYPSPEKNDYNPRSSYEMTKGKPDSAYNSNGWRPFAHGHNPEVWNVFRLDRTDIQDICDALWGPQEDLRDNTDDKRKLEHCRLLVNSVRVSLAAAGIHCKIACVDEEKDSFTHWEISRIRDWMCREIRNACGFQLKRDLKEVSQDVFVERPYIESIDAENEAIYDELYDEVGYDLF